jgi:DNA-binding CsgD family transcriptional regulator
VARPEGAGRPKRQSRGVSVVLRGYKPLAAVALSSPPTPVGGSPFGRQNGESSPLVSRGTSWRTICLPGIETPGSRRPKLATGATEAAVAEARLALAAFERLGAAREADAASGLLRQLGAAGRAFPRRYGERTKCETEVLSLVADGLSNAQIAERLFISRRTAEHHVASILSKLGLRTRAEAAAYAVREAAETPVSA